jgi:hypothetical protein
MTEIAEAVDMMVSDEIEAQERAGNANPGWERAFANIAEEVARRNAAPANGTVAALTADMVAAGGTLPYPGTGSDASATPAVPNSQVIHDLDRRVLQAQTDGYPQSRDIEREQSAALPRLACAGCSGREAPMTRPRPGTGMSIRRANALDSQGGMARLMDMTMTRRCLVCGDKKSGCTDYCRTHKFAVRAGARRAPRRCPGAG